MEFIVLPGEGRNKNFSAVDFCNVSSVFTESKENAGNVRIIRGKNAHNIRVNARSSSVQFALQSE